jgi:biopolymer transport protein ExbD
MSKSMVPLIDLVFLTLGSVLAAMTQMEKVEALGVDVARVGAGQAVVEHGQLKVVTVDEDGLRLEGRPIAPEELARQVGPEKIVLRAQRALPTERTLQALADLADLRLDVVLEVTTHRETDALDQGS